MPVLSIVVPVYNVVSYLQEGLDSILQQDVQDMEVICVNDCSTDSSPSILKEYQEKDKRVQVVHHTINRGLSATRNTGLSWAKGTYIAFFDPDDKVEKGLYIELIQAIEKKGADVAMCGFTTFPNGQTAIPNFKAGEAMKPADFIQSNKHILSSNDLCFTWRFVFRASLLRNFNLRFIEEIRIGEDMIFNLACVMQASAVIMVPKALYRYRTNNASSLMKLPFKSYLEDSLQRQTQEKFRLIRKYNIDHYTPATTDLSEYTILHCLPMLIRNLYNNPQEPDKRKGIQRILSMPMIRDAMKVVGFRNIYPTRKEYLFYLAMKFKWTRFVCYKYNQMFVKES